jgi:6-phosphofructokinase 1
VLLPEQPTDIKAMCAHLKKVHARDKVAIVVTSEAVELPGMKTEGEELDQFGHMLLKNRNLGDQVAQLIEKETGIETRSAVIGHIQRGGSPTLFDRILGTRVGAKAADLVAAGDFGKMVALRGNEVTGVSLEEATSKLKTVPPEWLKLADVFFK